jgi:hypothetical protein
MDYSLIVEQLKEGIQDLRIRNSGLAFKNAELEIYCDRLAQGLPEGMLPKDIENIREANCHMAQHICELEEEIRKLKSKQPLTK